MVVQGSQVQMLSRAGVLPPDVLPNHPDLGVTGKAHGTKVTLGDNQLQTLMAPLQHLGWKLDLKNSRANKCRVDCGGKE